MITIVACPACQQNLQVPPAQFGKPVRCPGCEHVFSADSAGISAGRPAPPPLPANHVPAWERGDELAEPIEEVDLDEVARKERKQERARRREQFRAAYDDLVRRDQTAHRGVLILIYGILSLMCSMGIFGLYFGMCAWQWGNHDLQEMYAGRMDRSGETLTKVGRILGIIGLCLFAVGVFAALGCGVIGAVLGTRR
jgi:hypothetical protein